MEFSSGDIYFLPFLYTREEIYLFLTIFFPIKNSDLCLNLLGCKINNHIFEKETFYKKNLSSLQVMKLRADLQREHDRKLEEIREASRRMKEDCDHQIELQK